MTNWNERKTATSDLNHGSGNPGPAGWLLIVLMAILAPITTIAIVYMVAQYSDRAAAGIALILLAGWAWGLSGWKDGG